MVLPMTYWQRLDFIWDFVEYALDSICIDMNFRVTLEQHFRERASEYVGGDMNEEDVPYEADPCEVLA